MNGQVRQRGKDKNSFELRVWLGRDPDTGQGRTETQAFHGTKREAQAAANRLAAECDKRQARGVPPKAGTFEDLVERWFTTMAPDWSPGTVDLHRKIIDSKLSPLAGIRLDKLNTATLDEFYGQLRATGSETGGPLSKATVRRVHGVVHSALEQAVAWDWMLYNPATRALKNKKAIARPPIQVPKVANVQTLLERAWEVDARAGAFLTLGGYLGRRPGELLALRWTDFDREAATLNVSRTIVKGPNGLVEKPTTKNAKACLTPLEPETVAVLVTHRKRCLEQSLAAGVSLAPNAYIFAAAESLDGLSPEWPSSASRRVRHVCQVLGLEPITMRELRRFTATTMIKGGSSLATEGEMLGHGATVALAHYTASDWDDKKKASRAVIDRLARG